MPIKDKKERAEADRKRYLANRTAKLAYQSEYRRRHEAEVKEANRRWRENNREYHRETNRQRYYKGNRRDIMLYEKYGIREVDYRRMYLEQEGRCGICSKFFEVLAVDHDHVSGRVRGLLCRKCNGGIGLLNDDIALLRRALAYLETH